MCLALGSTNPNPNACWQHQLPASFQLNLENVYKLKWGAAAPCLCWARMLPALLEFLLQLHKLNWNSPEKQHWKLLFYNCFTVQHALIKPASIDCSSSLTARKAGKYFIFIHGITGVFHVKEFSLLFNHEFVLLIEFFALLINEYFAFFMVNQMKYFIFYCIEITIH